MRDNPFYRNKSNILAARVIHGMSSMTTNSNPTIKSVTSSDALLQLATNNPGLEIYHAGLPGSHDLVLAVFKEGGKQTCYHYKAKSDGQLFLTQDSEHTIDSIARAKRTFSSCFKIY